MAKKNQCQTMAQAENAIRGQFPGLHVTFKTETDGANLLAGAYVTGPVKIANIYKSFDNDKQLIFLVKYIY